MVYYLADLANRVGGELVGEANCEIKCVASLDRAGKGDICFVTDNHYRQRLKNTLASAVILDKSMLVNCPVFALVVTNPYLAYVKIARLLNPGLPFQAGIHPSAVIHPEATIHPDVSIGPLCVIEHDVVLAAEVVIGPACTLASGCSIEEGSHLVSHVTLCKDTIIGKRALIHPGVVIGSDGFGLVHENGEWIKVPQLGRVVIGDDVEIGANTTIDRGTLDDTVIGQGVKLDNLVQVAHNVHIGAHTAIAGCVGIAGSAKIGKYCVIGGAAGIQGHIEIGDHVTITGMTKVTKSIRSPGVYTSGTPFERNDKWLKNSVRFKQLDSIARRLRLLEKK